MKTVVLALKSIVRKVMAHLGLIDWMFLWYFLIERFSDRGVEKSHLVLVEIFSRGNAGHFRWWMLYFATHLCKRFKKVVVCTNDVQSHLNLWDVESVAIPENLVWRETSFKNERVLNCRRICEACNVPTADSGVFFIWGEDLLPYQKIRKRLVPWGVLTSLSFGQRKSVSCHHHRRLIELFGRYDECKCVVQADQFIDGVKGKNIWVPDVEKVELLQKPNASIARVDAHVRNSFSIGSFGSLTGDRCVDGITYLSKEHPDWKFVLVGKYIQESVSDCNRSTIEASSEILLVDTFVETESEFNSFINTVDAVFIDSRNYPLQSGIIMKALCFGKFIVSNSGDSWTNDMIKKYNIGCTYTEFGENLEQEWERWKVNGGPDHNREVFAALTSEDVQNACFDDIKCLLVI